MATCNEQPVVLPEEAAARSLLDQLLADSRLYRRSTDYWALLKFVARLRNFAPFNAMLLQVQKPGLRFAASERDWSTRFGRWPKEGARPLLILWPFAPVALVYDVMDTEGAELPQDVMAYYATGEIDEMRLAKCLERTGTLGIELLSLDAGDGSAGWIRVVSETAQAKTSRSYRLAINQNHAAAVRFATLVHELGHLFLGHLGADKLLSVPARRSLTHNEVELEAESLAFLVCARVGVWCKSETYLTDYVQEHTTVENLDFYSILRAAGRVEDLLRLSAHTGFDRPSGVDPGAETPGHRSARLAFLASMRNPTPDKNGKTFLQVLFESTLDILRSGRRTFEDWDAAMCVVSERWGDLNPELRRQIWRRALTGAGLTEAEISPPTVGLSQTSAATENST